MLVGLPGSGKSTLGAKLAAQHNLDFIDDASIKFESPTAVLESILSSSKKGAVITDVYLCLTEIRASAKSLIESNPNLDVSWVYFENNPETCLHNVRTRNDGRRVSDFISTFSREYRPDYDCGVVLPVVFA